MHLMPYVSLVTVHGPSSWSLEPGAGLMLL